VGRKIVMYSFGVIALYLAVKNYTGFAKDETSAANGGSGIIAAFQGR
jgi:hypothetical protein